MPSWQMTRTLRQLRYQYCVANKLRSSFSRWTVAVKTCVFVRSVLRCIHPHCGVILRKLQCSGCVWPTTLAAGLSITCRRGRVLVATKFIAAFPLLMPCWENKFLERCKKSNNAYLGASVNAIGLFVSVPFLWPLQPGYAYWLIERCIVFTYLKLCGPLPTVLRLAPSVAFVQKPYR